MVRGSGAFTVIIEPVAKGVLQQATSILSNTRMEERCTSRIKGSSQ